MSAGGAVLVPMDRECEEHLLGVEHRAMVDLSNKYRRGQAEHGGELWKKGLLTLISREIREEALDLVVYSDVLEQRLIRLRELAAEGTKETTPDYMLRTILREIVGILDGTVKEKEKAES